jgi:DNA modification methylase
MNGIYNQDFSYFLSHVEPPSLYDLIIADPPYNEVLSETWDNEWDSDQAYLQWLERAIKEFSTVLTDQGNLLLYCKRQLVPDITIILRKYFTERRTILWVRKRDQNQSRGHNFSSGYEPILWFSKSKEKYFFNHESAKIPPEPHLKNRKEYVIGSLREGVMLSDAWIDIAALSRNSKEHTGHPSQKPLKLSERLVCLFSPKDSHVFIPFAGSGSEVIACRDNDRIYDACEINEEYYKIIEQRLLLKPKKIQSQSIEDWLPKEVKPV